MEDYLEKWQHFSLQTTIWASVLSLSEVYFASLRHQASCFVSYLGLLLGGDHHSIAFPFCERIAFSYEIMLPQKGEQIWSVIQATEAHCKHLMPTEPFTE